MTRRAEDDEGYAVYAVGPDGYQRRVSATALVLDLGHARLRITLRPVTPLMSGRMLVRVEDDGRLVVGPGDANGAELGVEAS